MSYKLIIKHEAFIDTVDAYLFYENRRVGLGEQFLDNLDLLYERIVRYPFHFPCKVQPYREALIASFPFIIVYEINQNDSAIIIFSVFNTYQNPNKKIK